MKIQTIQTPAGEDLIVLSRRDYDAMLAQHGDEEAEDRKTLLVAAESRGGEQLPAPVSEAVLNGTSLVKALRIWRGMTQVQLASLAGLNQGFLSAIEARSKQGSDETMARLAKALDVPRGWLA